MGLTQIRFCMVTPRIFKGVNSFGIGFPDA
jgi:hypothetical protein